MKKPHNKKRIYLVTTVAVLVILILGVGAYAKRDGIKRRIYSYQVQHQLAQQMQPLSASLTSIGFNNLPKPKTECIHTATLPKVESACTVTVTKYVVVGSGDTVAARLNSGAEQLSAQMDKNGWKQRKDYPVITWFKNIGQNVDYQPDQLDVRQLGDMTCTLDFTTAYSKPAPPAINMVMSCQKPAIPNDVLIQNF